MLFIFLKYFIESDSSIFYYTSEYKRYLVNYTIENTNTETYSNSPENNIENINVESILNENVNLIESDLLPIYFGDFKINV